MPVFRHLSTKVQRFALISKKKNEEMLKDWHFFEIFAKNIRMHYFCSRKRNDRPMTEEQIQEKKKYAGEKRPSMKGSTGDWYGCQFPKDEKRETEAGFRFFVLGGGATPWWRAGRADSRRRGRPAVRRGPRRNGHRSLPRPGGARWRWRLHTGGSCRDA